jgi:hypothetical protein
MIMENQEKKIIHSWMENENHCAVYNDFSIVTGSEKKLLTTITPDTKTFVANGVRYHIEDSLSIERWVFMQQLSIEMGFGVEFDEMLKAWQEQMNFLNKQNFVDAAVQAYNMVKGITKVFQRNPQILRFCSLFINTDDEDRSTITEDIITRKITDWKAEGLNIDGFFEFSLLKVKGLAEGYMSITQSVLKSLENLSQEGQLAADSPLNQE